MRALAVVITLIAVVATAEGLAKLAGVFDELPEWRA